MNIDEMRERLTALQDEIRGLADVVELDDEQRAAWDDKTAEFDSLRDSVADLEARQARAAAASEVRFNVNIAPKPTEVLEDRGATPAQLGDALVRSLEGKVAADNMDHVAKIARRHRSDRGWAAQMIARSSDEYTSAFAKLVTGQAWALTADEQRAAMSVGTNANGGYMVPAHLDPTLIVTNAGSSNAIRGISRVVTLTQGNVWNGVTSAGVTASWDAELAEVSDDSPTIAAVSVPVYKAAAFVQASTEAFEDIDGLASDVLMMFADARDRLEGAAHATGSGSSQPTGIFTAIDATATSEIALTTGATWSLGDLQNVYRSVPVRFRGGSTWVMNPLFLGKIQELGTAVSASYTTNLAEGYTGQLLGRPVVESDDAPSRQQTTTVDNLLVFGDFSNFLIVDKPGSASVTFIPTLFNTSNNLPDGRSGWYLHWRSGSDSTNDAAFRLLQDKTTA